MIHKIEINETLSRIIEIEADNEEEAIKEVKKQYMSEEIILNAEDYINTDFRIYQ